MNLRMKRLHTTVEHLGQPGEPLDRRHHEPGRRERLGRSAGGDELDAARRKPAREVDDALLVADRQQRTTDGNEVPSERVGVAGDVHCGISSRAGTVTMNACIASRDSPASRTESLRVPDS